MRGRSGGRVLAGLVTASVHGRTTGLNRGAVENHSDGSEVTKSNMHPCLPLKSHSREFEVLENMLVQQDKHAAEKHPSDGHHGSQQHAGSAAAQTEVPA